VAQTASFLFFSFLSFLNDSDADCGHDRAGLVVLAGGGEGGRPVGVHHQVWVLPLFVLSCPSLSLSLFSFFFLVSTGAKRQRKRLDLARLRSSVGLGFKWIGLGVDDE
jgi:hypothetical protein